MLAIGQRQRRAPKVGSERGRAMNQPHICPTIHACGPEHRQIWRAHGRNPRLRSSIVDLDHRPDLFLIFFGELLVFASAWPLASDRQMASFTTTETSPLQTTIAIVTAQRRMAEIAKLTSATAPFGPLVTRRPVWIKHCREHNTRRFDTTGYISITRRLGCAALAAITAHAITTSRG